MSALWLGHGGAHQPVHDDCTVIVRYRNGQTSKPISARKRRWRRWPDGDSDWDITAYRRS